MACKNTIKDFDVFLPQIIYSSDMKTGLLKIHLAVLLFGLAGLFAKWLPVHPIILVFGRVFFACISLLLILRIFKLPILLNHRKDYVILALLGAILAFHWASFFHSIQLSTIAIGLLTYSSFPLFVTFIEPLVFKEKLRFKSILTAILAIIGILIMVPEFDVGNQTFKAIIWGFLSALSFAILSISNRFLAKQYSGLQIAFYEDGFATIFLLPFLFSIPLLITTKLILSLVILGILFTALSHSLFIDGLKKVKAQTASIIASLEPVYGILFGLLIFSELPDLRTAIGGIIIIASVIISSIQKN